MTQRVPRELGDLARDLDTGRACANDYERKPRGASLGIGLHLRRLEGAKDAPAHDQRALERLDLSRVLSPVVVTEIGVMRASSQDHGVVRD